MVLLALVRFYLNHQLELFVIIQAKMAYRNDSDSLGSYRPQPFDVSRFNHITCE